MTDIVKLAERLFRQVEWQSVPSDVTQDDQVESIVEAIRYLYVLTGRSPQYKKEMFIYEDGICKYFDQELALDEEEFVLVTAQINFYRKVQSSVNQLVSYTTDAMTVAHGDKPFANLQQTIGDLESKQKTLWFKMGRFNLL